MSPSQATGGVLRQSKSSANLSQKGSTCFSPVDISPLDSRPHLFLIGCIGVSGKTKWDGLDGVVRRLFKVSAFRRQPPKWGPTSDKKGCGLFLNPWSFFGLCPFSYILPLLGLMPGCQGKRSRMLSTDWWQDHRRECLLLAEAGQPARHFPAWNHCTSLSKWTANGHILSSP